MDCPLAPCDSDSSHFLLREAAYATQSKTLLPGQGEWALKVIPLITADWTSDGHLAFRFLHWGSVILVHLCHSGVATHWEKKKRNNSANKNVCSSKIKRTRKETLSSLETHGESSELLTRNFWLLFFTKPQWLSCQSLLSSKITRSKASWTGLCPL